MQAMFFWNELLELPVHIASCTANMSVAAVHIALNLPNVQLEFGKPQIFYFIFTYIYKGMHSLIFVAILSKFPDVACQLSA